MANTQVGARVGAILGQDNRTIRVLGYGVYDGDRPVLGNPPDQAPTGPIGSLLMEVALGLEGYVADPVTNPCIRLDDGGVVWGCECWWGPEAVVQRRVESAREAGYTILRVKIERPSGTVLEAM